MTNINAVKRRVVLSGSAGTGPYAFTFEILDDDDIQVFKDTTLLTKTADYTVTINANGTGSVTLGVAATSSHTITIIGARDIARTTDFVTAGDLKASSLNEQLDALTIFDQQIDEKVDRSLKGNFSDPTNLDYTIPSVDNRKGKYLQFNATTGAPEAGPNSTDVTTLGSVASDIATLADIEDGTTATDAISGLAAIKANVTTVAGISSNVTTVAGISSNVTAVAGDASDIGTVASNISSVNTNATNISAIQGAAANASTATTKASEAASSATAAAASATTATTQASTATTQATTSTTKAGEAATSATASATSATASATSATAAASSATAAAASQTAAASSAAAAASSFDSFDDRYLGPKSSNPSQDNDGNALVSGALYFNSIANEMRVYDGANWIAATSAGNVSLILYEYTATSNQTTFSGSDDNSATLSYTVDNLQVVMNGVILDPSDYTATNGTSVVLAAGAATNDLVNIYAFKSFTTADMVSKTNGGTFAGAVTVPQLNADNIRIDGNTISSTDTNGNVTIDPAGTGDTIIASGNVGIGATTIGDKLVVEGATSATASIVVQDPTAADYGTHLSYDDANTQAIFGGLTNGTKNPALRVARDAASGIDIDASGNVGINNASPGQKLHVHGAAEFTAHDNNSGGGGYHPSNGLVIGNAYDAGKGGSVTDDRNSIIWNERGLDIDFGTSNTYRMKLDYNGNLLVGKTATNYQSVGVEAKGNGSLWATADGNGPLICVRKSSDGTIIQLYKNTAKIAEFKVTDGDNLSIDCTSTNHAGFTLAADSILPRRNGSSSDNAIDLGSSGDRFDDVFATNGTIQTSDQNEKQNIASLTTAEITAAKAISKLFKTFKWQDKVAAKGDAARTHTGVIAQEVQTAMTDAGLDAADYAFWCSDTWWETSTEVAAVEADEEAGIEAQDAYTRIDTYHTADEAPEGATQRTRLGVRYPELLAFIGAATEQRLGDIETRLAALENA